MECAMRLLSLILGLSLSTGGWAMKATEYLPEDAALDPSVPAPESVLGWEIGDWRISHDQLVMYLRALADASDRVSIKVIGRTHEQRPLLQLLFTSPDHLGRLEELRQRHLEAARGGSSQGAPLVVWLGYSIHGNEASGSNAAPLVAYYLAASGSAFVTSLLADSVVLLDPSFNPDGMQRFSVWSNSNRSKNPVADPNHRVHNETWPQNRTNHYLFDLNRDWLPLVHPESRARVAEFHRWLPHVLTDHHESRYDSYFFQPGVPTRQNPLTPAANLELTRRLAGYHAAALDAAGEMYFTEDTYDDFYLGKGSSYPDINGTIGILFEQPNVKGPVLKRGNRTLTFRNAIRNQFATTLSTLRGAVELREEFVTYQRDFFRTMAERAGDAGFAAWVMGDDGDPARAAELLDAFRQHQVEFLLLGEEISADGRVFRPGHAWVFPIRQRQFGMLQAMMEARTGFEDDTFYDVSAWTLPLAYNLPYARLRRMPATGQAAEPAASTPAADAVAWVVPWGQLGAPPLLQHLLTAGARVRAATRPFEAETAGGNESFSEGTLLIHRGFQDPAVVDRVFRIITQVAEDGLVVHSVTSGLTASGPDLGDKSFMLIEPIRPLLITGEGVSQYDAGATWHLFDQRLGVVPVMVEVDRLKSIRLHDYTHLIMVDGQYGAIGNSHKRRIVQWIRDGGILVATSRAAEWAQGLCFESEPDRCADDPEEEAEELPQSRPYGQFEDDEAQRLIGGAIVSTTLDRTHPLAFGYSRDELPLFRHGTTLLEPSDNAYATPVRYTRDPLLAGFIGSERLEEIRGQGAVIAERKGDGLVLRFADFPLFRGFWRGTERLFVNGLYLGQIVKKTEIPD
jgi:hypothetical protein